MKEKVLKFLAKSPFGTAIKVGLGSSLVYIIDNISSFNLNPTASTIVIAVVTVAINAVNPQDPRYGKSAGQ